MGNDQCQEGMMVGAYDTLRGLASADASPCKRLISEG
ncbi:uncharacterized protein METZ01_LOCUS231536 [marine metagenome]|uniref:Uncharacterized protein n=1 Tax=marine metagenome TaxID=408172 RepID=A0A382GUX4_9ZZZZ